MNLKRIYIKIWIEVEIELVEDQTLVQWKLHKSADGWNGYRFMGNSVFNERWSFQILFFAWLCNFLWPLTKAAANPMKDEWNQTRIIEKLQECADGVTKVGKLKQLLFLVHNILIREFGIEWFVSPNFTWVEKDHECSVHWKDAC